MKKLPLITIICMCLLFHVSGAEAAMVRSMDLGRLVNDSDLIFQGKVKTVDSEWDGQRTTIWTYVTFQIDEIIKGNWSESEITLKLPGGAIKKEDIRLQASGVPQFQEGEEVLIFCDTENRTGSPIIGWSQGRFRIRFDGQSGKKVITEKRAAKLIPSTRSTEAMGATTAPVTYDAFIKAIREIIEPPRGTPATKGLGP
jgi:hypothetical protein